MAMGGLRLQWLLVPLWFIINRLDDLAYYFAFMMLYLLLPFVWVIKTAYYILLRALQWGGV